MSTADRAVALRAWARGDLAIEAAVELLVRTQRGHLLQGPWVRQIGSRYWFDPACAHAEGGHLSGGERRVLAIAMSLADPGYPVDLGDAMTGLDQAAAVVVLEALAHAARIPTSTT